MKKECKQCNEHMQIDSRRGEDRENVKHFKRYIEKEVVKSHDRPRPEWIWDIMVVDFIIIYDNSFDSMQLV